MPLPAPKIATREDVRKALGHFMVIGFHGTSVTPELRELLREIQPLGVILFGRNIESPQQVCELNKEIKSLQEDPLLTSVDQEGGRVARIRAPATEFPPMRKLGQLDDADLVRRVGKVLGTELRAMNFDVNFAPVLDIDTNPGNPVIGDRAFADNAEDVCRLSQAYIQGLREGDVGPCGKHFPGHGDTSVDSHLDLPLVEHELPRLREVEWQPFKHAIKNGLDAIMSAHVVICDIDPDTPATLSPASLAPLRTELGHQGIIVSDDLEMKAISSRYEPHDIARLGLQAGLDVFLPCNDPAYILDIYRGLVRCMEDDLMTHEELLEKEKRVLQWRDRYLRPVTTESECRNVVGTAVHQDVADEAAERLSAG